ncbi:MAG TPA: GNAT family N-acetyltransferase [Candidatus Binatia bacterium]|nr:GNAT family N-acetyltransferase [Candidatus Binatia bacterium]
MKPIELRDARDSTADREWLANVYPFYLHDLSEFEDHYYRLNDRGLWEPDHLPSWLQDDEDLPLVIIESGARVGFALVNVAPSPHVARDRDFRLSEFFVLRRHRRRGVGRRAAWTLFERMPGRWQLSALARNARAIRFWRGVIEECARGEYDEVASSHELLYLFEAGPRRKD